MANSNEVSCIIDTSNSSEGCHFIVKIPPKITESFFNIATETQIQEAQPVGFKKGTTPLSYIQKHFKNPIGNHLKELALKFFGFDALLQHIRKNKIVLVGPPSLEQIEVDNQGNTVYHFKGSCPQELYMQSWKYLPFKPIPRKKYRDIDKQVQTFLEQEAVLKDSYKAEDGIQIGDWVCFQATLIDKNQKPIFQKNHTQTWLKIGDEEPDLEIQKLFVGKQIKDSFVTDNRNLQSYFCQISDNTYAYKITIVDWVPCKFFSLDLFKQFFKIKTQKDLHNKLIEVFSFNSDVSQRRLTAFEALGLIMRKNHIVLPNKSVQMQKKEILQDMQGKADFMVYKMDDDFDTHLTQMAKRQLTDSVIAEHIAYQDNLSINHQDIKALLHLTQRPRIKDFIYFPFLKTQQNGHENPIDEQSLYHFCLKEKAINHIIHHLTKK